MFFPNSNFITCKIAKQFDKIPEPLFRIKPIRFLKSYRFAYQNFTIFLMVRGTDIELKTLEVVGRKPAQFTLIAFTSACRTASLKAGTSLFIITLIRSNCLSILPAKSL